MMRRGQISRQSLEKIHVQVGGSRESWIEDLQKEYPEVRLPVVLSDRDIVAIHPIKRRLIIA
jgi:hypothetical protein